MRTKLLLPAVLLASTIFPAGAAAALGDLQIVSRADGTNGALADENASSGDRGISADGRYVLIDSQATNLVGPLPAARNIYRRDLLLGRTELVSRATGVNGAAGDDGSFNPTISADGQRVAFNSNADNLSAADNNAYSNIFVRDFTQNTTVLVSRASGAAGGAANGGSLIPLISGDGTVVAFQSVATNLDPTVTDNNGAVDAYVRDFKNDTTRLVSKSSTNVLGDGLSTVGDLSADGNKIVIESEAENLGGTVSANSNVYVRDRSAGTTTLVNQPTGNGNVGSDGDAGPATITANGNKIAFASISSDLATDEPPAVRQIYVRDLAAATTELVSRSTTGAPGAADSDSPAIAANGQFVVFVSDADNLEGPASGATQAFVRTFAGQTFMVSRAGRDGAPAQFGTTFASPGLSDRFVAFNSDSPNLLPEATGASYQTFIRDVFVVDPVPPTPTYTISAKRFTAKLSRRKFKLKVTTTGGPTLLYARVTISVSKRIARSRKIVVRLFSVPVLPARNSHTLTFTVSKKQNKLLLKALKSKRTRLRASVLLNAGPGQNQNVKVSGKLRR